MASSIGRIKLPSALSETQLKTLVTELAEVLSTAACESRSIIPSSHIRGRPWWNKDLCALHHKTRQAFKRWSAIRTDENRVLFSSFKAAYQRELRRAKRQSWNLLCKANPNSNDLFSAIKELSGKARGISLLDAIVGNGSPETDDKLILNQCVAHFFPTESPSLSTHLAVESLIGDVVVVPTLQEGPIVTVEDLVAAVESLNYKAAPGNDGISAAIIKECFPVIKMHLFFIVSECVCLNFFSSVMKILKSNYNWHAKQTLLLRAI